MRALALSFFIRSFRVNSSRLVQSLVAGTFAFWCALSITRPLGPGLDPDARAYLYAAGTLAHQGVLRDVRDDWVSPDSTRSLTRWPPAFPVAIAVPVAAGMEPVESARLVMALSAFAALGTLVWLVIGAAGDKAGRVLMFALLLTPAMAIVHESVLSEPLFLATLAMTLAMMARPRPAPLSEGLAAAAASMVRYAGLAAVGAVVLWELLRDGTARDRLRRAAIAAAPSLVVNLWWWLRAAQTGGHGAVRNFSLYGQLSSTLIEGAATVSAWLVPLVAAPLNSWVAVILIAALVIKGAPSALRLRPWAALFARGPRAEGPQLIMAAALLTLCYLGLVLAARVIADPDIPLDERLLSPAILLVTVIIVTAAMIWWERVQRKWQIAAAVAGAVWLVLSLSVTGDSVRYALDNGNDYADKCWVASPVVGWVHDHGAGHPLVSNAPIALFFQAGRLAREMPDDGIPADSMQMFRDTLAARRAYVVLFDEQCASTIEQPDSLVKKLGLEAEARLRSGVIWRAK